MKKISTVLVSLVFMALMCTGAMAASITAGDAASQADADSILDIVFAMDISGSMYDEIAGITNYVNTAIRNLDCPDCDVWVRARFMAIDGTYGTLFNESLRAYVDARNGTATNLINNTEDNGPAVTELVNWYGWNNDAVAGQNYYRAIVTIGDEGTQDGEPIYQNDWDAAYTANQAAVNAGIMVFSLVGTGATTSAQNVFRCMAEGGTGGGHTFGDTNGLYMLTTNASLESDLERIICTAAQGGGNNPVPEPTTLLLVGSGLLGLAGWRKKRS